MIADTAEGCPLSLVTTDLSALLMTLNDPAWI